MYKVLDVIQLTHDIPEENLKEGSLGTIIEILSELPNMVYEIEFCNEIRETIATLALDDHCISLYYEY